MGLKSYVTYRPSLGRGSSRPVREGTKNGRYTVLADIQNRATQVGIVHELCVLGQAAVACSGPNGGEGVDLTPPCQTDDEVESFICFI